MSFNKIIFTLIMVVFNCYDEVYATPVKQNTASPQLIAPLRDFASNMLHKKDEDGG